MVVDLIRKKSMQLESRDKIEKSELCKKKLSYLYRFRDLAFRTCMDTNSIPDGYGIGQLPSLTLLNLARIESIVQQCQDYLMR